MESMQCITLAEQRTGDTARPASLKVDDDARDERLASYRRAAAAHQRKERQLKTKLRSVRARQRALHAREDKILEALAQLSHEEITLSRGPLDRGIPDAKRQCSKAG